MTDAVLAHVQRAEVGVAITRRAGGVHNMPRVGVRSILIDCDDPESGARFWTGVRGSDVDGAGDDVYLVLT